MAGLGVDPMLHTCKPHLQPKKIIETWMGISDDNEDCLIQGKYPSKSKWWTKIFKSYLGGCRGYDWIWVEKVDYISKKV